MAMPAGAADQGRIGFPEAAIFAKGVGIDSGYKTATIRLLGQFRFDGWDRPVVEASCGCKTQIGKVAYEAANGQFSHSGTVRVPMVGRMPWNALLSAINGVELWSIIAE
jgi:hypothetical protein